MRVAVLGCGPAGLVVAHAVNAAGATPVIFSRKVKSPIHGSQVLKQQIPGVPVDSAIVRYRLDGDIGTYLSRIYGHDYALSVTDALDEDVLVYDLRQTYTALWDLYSPYVLDIPLGPHAVGSIQREYDLVISTIPANALCVDDSHKFIASYIWAAGETEDRDLILPALGGLDDNMIIRNGQLWNGEWTRASRTFGIGTIEWPDHRDQPVATAARVPKPISTDCTCWPRIAREGRFGRWDKDSLVHHGFDSTIEIIRKERRERV